MATVLKDKTLKGETMEDSILIKKHFKGVPIQYPEQFLPPNLFVMAKPRQDNDDIIDFSELEPYREGEFEVSHVESLQIPQRYIRGIVKYKDVEYVFTATVDLMTTIGKVDMAKVLKLVTLRIAADAA